MKDMNVEQALAQTGLTQLRHASVLTLSGGELQRGAVFRGGPPVRYLSGKA